MNTVDDQSLGAGNETPVDFAAVQADDALLDALNDGEFDEWLRRANAEFNREVATQVDVELALAKVLYAWRRDVDADPIPVLIRLPFLARMRAALRGFFRLGGE